MAIVVNPTAVIRVPTFGTPSITLFKKNTFLEQMKQDVLNVFIPSGGNDFADSETTISYHHSTGEVLHYPGIFQYQTAMVGINGGGEVISRRPTLTLAASRMARKPDVDDKVFVRGEWYFVEKPEEGTAGTVLLTLRRR